MSVAPRSRRRWLVLAVLVAGQMIVNLDVTIINTALPAIKRAFELSESQSLWVADAYLVIFGGLLLLAGALGDRFGRRRILMLGMTVFVLASIGVAFSPNANFLIVGRGLQGLGGAMVIPQTLSILTAVRIERVCGITIAPPRPCRPRPTIRKLALGENATPIEARTNTVIPSIRIRRRPKRSPSAPASKSKPPKITR